MRRPRAAVLLTFTSLLLAAEKPAETPRESGLVESATTRLAQIDVSAFGPDGVVDRLGKEDFELKINHNRVREFIVDRLCGGGGEDVSAAPDEPAPPPPHATSYLLYFDQNHLTMRGRQRALDLAREMVPALLTRGSRAMIVSSSAKVRTVLPLTSYPGAVVEALGRLERDREQWDPYPQQEMDRLNRVQVAQNEDFTEHAVAVARTYFMEDRWRAERSVKRLTMTLGLLSEVDAPKAVLYFADTMRNNPGVFYLDMFSQQVQERFARGVQEDNSSNLLDAVILEAASHQIRFYTIEAQGLVTPDTGVGNSFTGSYLAANQKIPSMVGIREAEDSLVHLAVETGGQAFLNGAPANKIVAQVRADMGCVYLISFDPTGFPEDAPLAVKVKVTKEGVELRTRGLLVVQSEPARRTSKLLSAFLAPDVHTSEVALRANLIPTGYSAHSFKALVQIAVAATDLPGATWDVGTSIVSRERVRDEFSERLSINVAGAPVVLEREIEFSPGPYELVSVAHEASTGQVASRHDEGAWPELDAAEAVVGPIAIVQPTPGAFSREQRAASGGNLALSPKDPARTDRATALVGIVCRAKSTRGTLRVERTLIGETSVPFPSMEMELGDDRCGVIRDLVPAGTMSPGYFRYEIRVLRKDQEIARAERAFSAVPAR